MCVYITMSYIKTKQEVQINVTYMYNVLLNNATKKVKERIIFVQEYHY